VGLTLAREAGVSRVEVDALTCLGMLDGDRGRLDQARALAVETGYRYGETVALIGLAGIATDPTVACAQAERAVALAHEGGFALLEARARRTAESKSSRDRPDGDGHPSPPASAAIRKVKHGPG
jgi:hypothetical protein